MTNRWITVILLSLALALPLSACGKKPSGVKAPEGAPTYPKQYPATR